MPKQANIPDGSRSVYSCCKSESHNETGGAATNPAVDSLPYIPTSLTRRSLDVAGWMVPATLWALLPKCPMCLAAYVALGTGIGLSAAVASQVRSGLVLLCLASILVFGVRNFRHFVHWRRRYQTEPGPVNGAA